LRLSSKILSCELGIGRFELTVAVCPAYLTECGCG
jgi:hypothetical protein